MIRQSIFHRFLNILKYTEREMMLWDAIRFVKANKVQGDYWEFGVYKGDSFIMAYDFARRESLAMKFIAFDSFQGLPVTDEGGCFFKGQYDCSMDAFDKRLKRAKVRDAVGIEGFYSESLSIALQEQFHLEKRKIAIVNIDSDLYSSAVEVLRFIGPFLQEGSIIMFDDWYAYGKLPRAGEQKAFDEWCLKDCCEPYKNYGWHGKSFIYHNSKHIRR